MIIKIDEQGVTLVELMVSLVILMTILMSAFQFFESYKFQSSELGEYDSAKFLALSGIENEKAKISEGDSKIGVVFENESYANKTKFITIVEKKNVTTDYAYINEKVAMYELTSTVSWKGKKLEVSTYVSAD